MVCVADDVFEQWLTPNPCPLCVLRAKEALSQSCAKIATHFDSHGGHGSPLTVPFKGVGAFSSSLLFACVDPSETDVLQHLRIIASEDVKIGV